MAIHNYVIPDQGGALFRADLNSALAAIVSHNSGTVEPTTTLYPYMLWADTTANKLKVRNAANNAWIDLFTLSTGVSLGNAALAGSTSQDFSAQKLTVSKGINEARGTVAMHATTMDLWAQPNIIEGTSTAQTVTAIVNAPQAGASRRLYPVAGSILTYGPTPFNIDGGASVTAAAGDAWDFEAITASTYKVHVMKNTVPVVTNSINTWSAPQRGTVTNNGSSLTFVLDTTNNFKCSVSTTSAITFTGRPVGQTGSILFIQTGTAAPTLSGATVHMNATDLATLGAAGTYLINYASLDGTNVECVVSRKLA
jgi:hypothetical protein